MSILSTMVITSALAGSICTGSLPENCEIIQSGINSNTGYIIGSINRDCEETLKELFDKLCVSFPNIPNLPEFETPEAETPDTDSPDSELPDSEVPDSETPDSETPDSEIPDSETPDSETPDSEIPDSEIPDSEIPDSETPDSEVPDTNTPENDGGNSDSEENVQLSFSEQVAALVNEQRAAYGLNPLTIHDSVMSAALTRSKEIKQSFSHTRPNGSSFSSVLKEHGVTFRGSGENIAYGQRTPQAVMNAWMNSPGHRANILNEKFTSIGVGCYESNGTLYWTQLFIY